MSAIGKKMKPIDDEIARIDAEIARLQGKRDGLVHAKALYTSGSDPHSAIGNEQRKRSPNIKPLILDFMASVGPGGATSADVSATIRGKVPTVAKDTVGSVLSRLKSDKALVFDGMRYYDARFAPKGEQHPFEVKVLKLA